MKKRISISSELDLLMATLRGVRTIAEDLLDAGGNGRRTSALAYSIRSILIAIDERTRNLDRAVRGELDPEFIWSEHTRGWTSPDEDGADLTLEAWTFHEKRRHAKAEWERLERRTRSQKSKRAQGAHVAW